MDVEGLLKSCGTVQQENEDTISRLLKSCGSIMEEPVEKAEKKAARIWSCPFCIFQVKVGENSTSASNVIAKHLKAAHQEQRPVKIKENGDKGIANVPWTGLGLRRLAEPVKFEKLTAAEMMTADFICPFCRCGMKCQPTFACLRKRSKIFHLKHCEKKPSGKIGLMNYWALSLKIKGSKLHDNFWRKRSAAISEQTGTCSCLWSCSHQVPL